MEDWGPLTLTQIKLPTDFWSLYDEMLKDKSDFIVNRNTILEAFAKGNLYGLTVDETDSMYNRGAMADSIFARDVSGNLTMYLIPGFCIKSEDGICSIMWFHSRARRKGFGKKLVELAGIKKASHPIREAMDFWQKCNVELINATFS